MSDYDWQKSTFSPDGSNCLNIAATGEGRIKFRESDHPATMFTTAPGTLRNFILKISLDPSAGSNRSRIGTAMDVQEFPREYRANRRKTTPILFSMACMTASLLLLAWTLAIFHTWAKLLVSVVAPLFAVGVAVSIPRTGTYVDRTGVRIQGPIRTHRLTWAEIQDIRTEPMPLEASGNDSMPNVIAYAYLQDGRRKLLIHFNDLHLPTDFDREIALLRTAWAELRDADPAPGAPSA